MAYNSYQIQPLKIDYTNLPEGIDKEELEQAAASGQQRNRLFQLITRAGDAMQPAKSALEKAIFGEQEEPKITTGEDGKTNVTVNNNRTGGLLGFANDVAKGFSENVSTPYSPNNMLPSKKGFAQRFGEGLGTATRLLDNSAVRGAIAYGLSKSLGDNNALEQGLTAASMNMAAKNNDKLYRNDLENMGVDTSGINGYITEDMYKNILASRQMQENAEWRKLQMEMTRQQNEALNAYRDANIALGYEKLNNDKIKNNNKAMKFKVAIGDADNALAQIQEMRELIKTNKGATGLLVGSLAKGNEGTQKIANELMSPTSGAIKTRAAISKLRGTTMHDLAGTAQTLQEQRNLAPFLPDLTDSPETILAKLDQLEAELLRGRGTNADLALDYGLEIGPFKYANSNTEEVGTITTNNAQPKTNALPATPKKIGKYTVEVQ